MELGGEEARKKLFEMVQTTDLASSMAGLNLNSYTEEEHKVAMYGEKG